MISESSILLVDEIEQILAFKSSPESVSLMVKNSKGEFVLVEMSIVQARKSAYLLLSQAGDEEALPNTIFSTNSSGWGQAGGGSGKFL